MLCHAVYVGLATIYCSVAGVKEVWVASPRPHPVVLAAAHVAGVDGLLAVGGCQVLLLLCS
jgi:phosphoribosyl-ATP pyrophosphohydrolase/phosphoribosyl-AMP cyclohydrolase/histidinol dehydrogenase